MFIARKEKTKRNIYIYKLGSTVLKSLRRKRRRKDRKGRKVFYSHMNCRNASYVRGLNVDDHFGKPDRKKKPSNMGRKVLVSG